MFFPKTVKMLSLRTINRKLTNFPKLYSSISFQDVHVPKITLPEHIFTECEKYGNYTAITCGLTGRKYTYGEVIANSVNLSKSLRQKLYLNASDVVALLLPNIPEYPIAILGVLHAGLKVTTLSHSYTSGEIYRQLNDSLAKTIITTPDLCPTIDRIRKTLNYPLSVVTVRIQQNQSLSDTIDLMEFIDNGKHLPEIPNQTSNEDVAFLPYSSGTTGLPKGVQLTHHNIVANLCQMSHPDLQILQKATRDNQDVVPGVAPMAHMFGFIMNTFFVFASGAQIVTLPKFTPNEYLQLLKTHKVTALFVAPPTVLFLSQHTMIKKEDLKSIKTVFCGGARLSTLDEEKFLEKAGNHLRVLQGYGLSETLTVTANSLKFSARGSVGRPIPNTLMQVVDPEGATLGPNSPGELLIKGPQVMKGYLNRAEETQKAFLDGWFRTGDIGYYDDDGFFFVTDRFKELIKVKGFSVAPAELEEIIKKFADVEDSAVIGVPSSRYGEVPRAYVMLKKNKNVNVKDLENYVKGQVADYKQLRGGVVIVDAIPKSASGKILRRELKNEYDRKKDNGK